MLTLTIKIREGQTHMGVLFKCSPLDKATEEELEHGADLVITLIQTFQEQVTIQSGQGANAKRAAIHMREVPADKTQPEE